MVYENNKSHKGDESHKEKPQGGQIEPPSSLFWIKVQTQIHLKLGMDSKC